MPTDLASWEIMLIRLNITQDWEDFFPVGKRRQTTKKRLFFSQGAGGSQRRPPPETAWAWCVQKGEGRMLVFACDLQQRSHCCVDLRENSLPHIHTRQGTTGQKKIIYKDVKNSVSCFWKLNLNTMCVSVCLCFPACGRVIDLSQYHSDCLHSVFLLRSDNQCYLSSDSFPSLVLLHAKVQINDLPYLNSASCIIIIYVSILTDLEKCGNHPPTLLSLQRLFPLFWNSETSPLASVVFCKITQNSTHCVFCPIIYNH